MTGTQMQLAVTATAPPPPPSTPFGKCGPGWWEAVEGPDLVMLVAEGTAMVWDIRLGSRGLGAPYPTKLDPERHRRPMRPLTRALTFTPVAQ